MIRFKLSQRTTEHLEKLTKLYDFKYETVTMRIAFAISLANDKRFSDEEQDNGKDGKEFSPTSNVFGRYINDEDNESIYYAVLCQHYDRALTNTDFTRLYKLHLSDGLQYWSDQLRLTDTISGGHVKYLAKIFNKGLALKPNAVNTASSKPKIDIPEYKALLKFNLGEYKDGSKVEIRLNDLREFDNRNMAIAGMAGSGKTQLIKDVLYQISQNTNHELKFTFFDYKGEGDSKSLTTFLDSTNCKFVDIINDGGIDFNPLSAIQTEPNQRTFSIKSFVETIATFTPDIGVNQKSILADVLNGLIDKLGDRIPTVSELFESLKEYYKKNNKKPDSLFAGIDNLSSNLFNCSHSESVLLNESIYLNLPPMLSDSLRQLIVFLILRYIVTYYSSTNDCIPEDNIFPLRHVVVIDEAHIYLKNRSASTALEEMLRLLRSKGVVIIMLSQGAEDYKTKNFDFVSQVKIPICLNIQNKDYRTIEHFLGTPKSSMQMQEAIDQLAPGKGIINLNEPTSFKLAQWWQTEQLLR
ncbi:DndE family protein [Psychrobacter sanguinis]|uniref:DndE family protein n=1 Tax=Psychrobacter sanguinis TaxID=861445 RepID=UPI00191B78B1|nr:DndE family protein [Psychrobacter sanguinis]MCC3308081.1 DndE family protein [Psychrobacter sanguinis]UEC25365.1 DndE family protein [Psychrobacter sanguinis]